MDAIERNVRTALRKLDQRSGRWPDEKCTREVKDVIGEIGEKLGLMVYASACRHKENGEWLYDLCLCKQDDDLVLRHS